MNNRKRIIRETRNYVIYFVGKSLRAKGKTKDTNTFKAGWAELSPDSVPYILSGNEEQIEAELAMVGA